MVSMARWVSTDHRTALVLCVLALITLSLAAAGAAAAVTSDAVMTPFDGTSSASTHVVSR